MNTKFYFSTLFIVILAFGANAQICGSDLSRLSEKELAAAMAFYRQDHPPVEKGGPVDSVAVTIHIVESRTAGAIALTEKEIETEIERVNRIFAGLGIEFFICGSPRHIQGEFNYTFESGDALNRFYRVPETINIYFVDQLQISDQDFLCGYAQFPYYSDIPGRYVMMAKGCSTNGSTLIHELGHFYGLFHTHETFPGLEYVDGSNCEEAGDMLCDTAADPNLGRANMMSGCTYTGDAVDPKGQPYVPPVTNFMSYAPSACRRFFSEEQKAIIKAINENENAYLTNKCDFYPDFGISTDFSSVSIRSDEAISANFTIDLANLEEVYDVVFKVSLAREADEEGLLLHEERLTLRPEDRQLTLSFDLDIPIELSTGTYYLQGVIDAEKEIIEVTERNNVASAVVEIDNSSLDDFVLFPNPVGDELKLFFRDAKLTGAFQVRIFSYDGRLVREQEGYKNQEEYFKLLDLSDMTTGIYFIAIDFEKRNVSFTSKFFRE